MPSWNIHTAHVEWLLSEHTPAELGISDTNVFLFGNFVPDIYVGFMVPDTTYKINYLATHMADPSPVPLPHADRFRHNYLRRRQTDLCRGVWAHLMADYLYNFATREFLAAHDLQMGEQTRIKKQADFADFGRTLPIAMRVEATPELIQAGAEFPHYTILERDVRAAVDVANGIVEDNRIHHISGVPDYRMLDAEFFAATFHRVNDAIVEGLLALK